MNSHVVLFNDGILPTYVVVHFAPSEAERGVRERDVREIELFADEQLRTLICDSIALDDLPPRTKASLLAALNKSREAVV